MAKKYAIIGSVSAVLLMLLFLIIKPTTTGKFSKESTKAIGILKQIEKADVKKEQMYHLTRAFNTCENEIGYEMRLKVKDEKAIVYMEPVPKYEYKHKSVLKRFLRLDFTKVKRSRYVLTEDGVEARLKE